MTFNDAIASDRKTFLGNSEFEENITYTRKNPITGATEIMTIKAVVERSIIKPAEHAGRRFPQNIYEVWIANDETTGVTIIKAGQDIIELTTISGTTIEMRITKIIDQDSGMWYLEAQA